jgi:hypothetical protein
MRRSSIVLVFVILLLMLPVGVHAQQDYKLQLAYISVWPEYEYSPDNPGKLNVLVINRFVLDSQDVQYPVKVKVQIPATALKAHVVAVGQTPETVSDQDVDFTTSAPSGDWIDVLVTTSGPAIQLEYYDYNIVKTGVSREYIYHWPGTYAVGSFHLDVRVPLHASNMRSDPDASLSGTDADGFKFGEMSLQNLSAGQLFTLKIDYDRDTDMPSSSFLDVQPAAPLDQPVSGQFSLAAYLPWILAGLLVLGVAGGTGWYWLSSRPGGQVSKVRKRGVVGQPKKDSEDDDGQVYCHECGKRAQPDDQFCRTCGAPLRQGES